MTLQDSTPSYKSLSKFYDVFDLIFRLGSKGNPRLGLLDIIDNTRQEILDVCVGTAGSSLLLAEHNHQNQILGIDISQEMLAVAQRKIAQLGLTNLQLRAMSAEKLQLPDNHFDVVMVSFALHEFEPESRQRVFREIARVLKPGGKFCLIDFAQQADAGSRFFIKLWTMIEPACFRGFLAIDWRTELTPIGLCYISEKEFSFSKLYVFRKA